MAPQHRLGRVLIVLAVGMLVMGAKLITSAPASQPEDDLVALAPAAPVASNKRKSKSPARALPSRPPTTRRAGQGSPNKSIRDFGF